MTASPRTPLELRARRIRASRLEARYAYAHRNHAAGAWHRLRRPLVDAEAAFVLPEGAAEELAAEGFRPAAVGAEFAPPLRLYRLPAERIERIAGVCPIAVRLSAELLTAPAVALRPFAGARLAV